MLNILWASMIVCGIVYAAFTGNLTAVSDGAINSAKDAISLCITMFGVISMWTGLMKVAAKAGLIEKCTHILSPVMRWLFPSISEKSAAMQHITTNVVANIFGLGWAATPAGLKAMEELSVINKESNRASKEMCTFLVINISSLQLIPVNMIAYRSQYGSLNPTMIVAPAIAATFVSTVVGVIFCKIMCRYDKSG